MCHHGDGVLYLETPAGVSSVDAMYGRNDAASLRIRRVMGLKNDELLPQQVLPYTEVSPVTRVDPVNYAGKAGVRGLRGVCNVIIVW